MKMKCLGVDQGVSRGLWFCAKLVGFGCLVTSVAGCGGGSSSQSNNFISAPIRSTTSWKPGQYNPAAQYQNLCASPRTGVDPYTRATYPDKKGTVIDENNFLRSWSNDTYLWYSELPDLDPSIEPVPTVYFDKLKTREKTLSGKAKDRYHFTYTTEEWNALSQGGVSSGYGMELSWISKSPPRNVVVAYTEPGSPAANAGIKRGAKLLKVDGYDFIESDAVSALNAALDPKSLNEVHVFEFQNLNDSTTQTVTLQSATVTKVPVQNVKVITTESGKVGYFQFNEHIATAERGLYDAINEFKVAGVVDLVLDVRYNGGGRLSIASELAYMIAGEMRTQNKTFEKLTFNDKHTQVDINGYAISPTPFYNASGLGALPSLNLSRVYVITTGDTCSASEAIINGLRGVDVEVIQIGAKTCGKPYGFYPEDNCGTTYFTIQFKGANQKGFGEYSDGFVPSDADNGMDNVKGCSLGDDLTRNLGDEAEKNLAAALYYRANGSCPMVANQSSVKLEKTSTLDYSNVNASLNKNPIYMNRFIEKPTQP